MLVDCVCWLCLFVDLVAVLVCSWVFWVYFDKCLVLLFVCWLLGLLVVNWIDYFCWWTILCFRWVDSLLYILFVGCWFVGLWCLFLFWVACVCLFAVLFVYSLVVVWFVVCFVGWFWLDNSVACGLWSCMYR